MLSFLFPLYMENNHSVINVKHCLPLFSDYIRTFTWDKKLETVVKSSVPNSKMPTIVSPIVYRTRFLEAMDRYFNVVPNRWTGLANDDC